MSHVKKASLKVLDEDMKKALRAASVFLTGHQRSKLHSFLQAPFTGNYNAQSGEIVGIIKNMKDTFESNLASARSVEVKTREFEEMSKAYEDKKKTIGDNSASIASESS